MRKIIVFNLISLDGYFAGPEGNIDWHLVDDEFDKFSVEQTKTFDTILFGRVTYQLFEDYWPKAAVDPATSPDDFEIASLINTMEKIVFSKTLENVEGDANWKNVRLYKEIVPEEITSLKQQPGQDMVIFGSGSLVQQFANLGLIDEYRLMVNPVVLGKGKPMFKDVKSRINLKLLDTKTFDSGNILLYYQPI